MKKFVIALAVLAALYFGFARMPELRRPASAPTTSDGPATVDGSGPLLAAIRDQRSGTQVTGEGTVTKLLADDNEGSRHQRFILTLPSGQTLLVAHNIDLAPRISAIKVGDSVAFNGVYEWNPKGGVIHWTHRDPNRRHEPGWLKHAGQTYE